MGKAEYEMFQEIPAKESGSTNLCHGLPFEVFYEYLESQLARKYQTISPYDTPTTIYLMYVDKNPVGYVGIRTIIDKNWKKWCGNIYYVIRPSEREKGYGTKILNAAIEKCNQMGLKEVYLCSSENNIQSEKVIENNNGIIVKNNGSKYYKISIN